MLLFCASLSPPIGVEHGIVFTFDQSINQKQQNDNEQEQSLRVNSILVGFKHFKQLEKLKKFLEISELLCPLATPMVQMTAGFIAVRQSPAENRIICCFVLFRDEVN